MNAEITDWLSLLLRWFHIMAGIMWIGTSFYFIWLGNALKPPVDPTDKKAGVEGEVWAVHGGGFYHKKKYHVAPDHMPEELHWFKWEAYLTWISGMLLLGLLYYYGAEMYLIDKTKMMLTAPEATLVGLGFIGGGWIFYDVLCKSSIGGNNRIFGLIWFTALTIVAYALNEIFSGRGAFMHIGAMIGTVMAVNVFAVIIPNQKKTVAALLAGKKPDPSLGKKAGQRSLHNNYMTLPVLLIMISNHYPMLFGNPYNWLVLAGLSASAWLVRCFFNQHEMGKTEYSYIAASAAVFILTVSFMMDGSNTPATTTGAEKVTTAEVRSIVRDRCGSCHSDTPTEEGTTAAPAGVMFDKIEEIKKHAPRIRAQAVEHDVMPPGNITQMTPEERKQLGEGLKSLK